MAARMFYYVICYSFAITIGSLSLYLCLRHYLKHNKWQGWRTFYYMNFTWTGTFSVFKCLESIYTFFRKAFVILIKPVFLSFVSYIVVATFVCTTWIDIIRDKNICYDKEGNVIHLTDAFVFRRDLPEDYNTAIYDPASYELEFVSSVCPETNIYLKASKLSDERSRILFDQWFGHLRNEEDGAQVAIKLTVFEFEQQNKVTLINLYHSGEEDSDLFQQLAQEYFSDRLAKLGLRVEKISYTSGKCP